jgi:hypothetical protein
MWRGKTPFKADTKDKVHQAWSMWRIWLEHPEYGRDVIME